MFIFLVLLCEISYAQYLSTPPSERSESLLFYDDYSSQFFILFGISELTVTNAEIWSFSITSLKWTQQYFTSSYSPGPRGGTCGCYFDMTREFYTFGGLTSFNLYNDLWKLSLASLSVISKQWHYVPTDFDPPGLYKYSCVCSDTKFYIFGGISIQGNSNFIFAFDIDLNSWENIQGNGNVPSKRFSASMHLVNNSILIWGGDFYDNSLHLLDLDTLTWNQTQVNSTVKGSISHASAVFNTSFWVFFGKNDSQTITNVYEIDIVSGNILNLLNFSNTIFPRTGFSHFQSGNNFYLFGGKNSDQYFNDFLLFSLEFLHFSVISSSIHSPIGRAYHKMVSLASQIFVFGGLSSFSMLNNIEIYDTVSKSWSFPVAAGGTPSKRAYFAMVSNENSIFVFGGQDSSGLLNDFFIYNTLSEAWTLISLNSPIPTRIGACMDYLFPYFFIFGGISPTGQYLNDLWLIDERNFEFKQIFIQTPPIPIAFGNCFTRKELNDTVFYLLFGKTTGEVSLNSLYKYVLSQNKWFLLNNFEGFERYDCSGIKTQDYLIVIGGRNESVYCLADILVINLKNSALISQRFTDFCVSAGSAVALKQSIYIFGGLSNQKSFESSGVLNNLIEIPLGPLLNQSQFCLSGSYLASDQCEYCPMGFYCEFENFSNYTPCPAGTYNQYIGIWSVRSCLECDYGTWNAETGKSVCNDCPVGYSCNTGCITPILSYYLSQNQPVSTQPFSYQSHTQQAKIANFLIFAFTVFTGLCIFFFSFWHKGKKFIKKIDIFKGNHNYEVGKKMYLEKTYIGGFFSLVFLCFLFYLIFSTIADLLLNDIIESKSLIPYILVQDQYNIMGNINASAVFHEYGGNCDNNSVDSSEISSVTEGISGNFSFSVTKNSTDCELSLICTECRIIDSSNITFILEEFNSYASSVSVSVSSTSSIPHEISTLSLSIYPSTQGFIFRGNLPTTVFFQFIPSLFLSNSYLFPAQLTGFHLNINQNPVLGSQISAQDIADNSQLVLEIVILQEDSILFTNRNTSQQWLTSFLTLLASGFGFSQLSIYVMRTFERIFRKAQDSKKKQKRKKIRKNDKKNFEMLGKKNNGLESFRSERRIVFNQAMMNVEFDENFDFLEVFE